MLATSIASRARQGQAAEFLPVLCAKLEKSEQHQHQGTALQAASMEKPLAWSGGKIRVVGPTAGCHHVH